MAYTYPNVTTFVQLLQYCNTVTNNLFGLLLALTTFLIITLRLMTMGYDMYDSVLAGLFPATIFCVILAAVGVVAPYVAVAFVVLFAITLILRWSSR